MSKRSHAPRTVGHSGGGFTSPSRVAGFFVSLKTLFQSDDGLPMVPPLVLPQMEGGYLRTVPDMPRPSSAHLKVQAQAPAPGIGLAPEEPPRQSLRRVAGSAGRWKLRLAQAGRTWPLATLEELVATDGHLPRLADLIRQRYGLSQEAAEVQVREFLGPHDAGA